MLSFFLVLSVSRRPFVLSPPMFGSVLYGNINKMKTHWYCKSSHKNVWLWLTDKYLIPPVTNCLAQYMKVTADPNTGLPVTRPETEVWTIDFGGDKAIRYLDPGLFGHHFIPLLYKVLDRFVTGGYKITEDMYGAPYDWRFNPIPSTVMDQYWVDLKALIESAYTSAGGIPVALYGFSAGNAAIYRFLTSYVNQAWKDTYVDRVVMMGPSYGGAFDAVTTLWLGYISFLPKTYQTADINSMATSVPTLFGHLPSTDSWGDRVLIRGPGGAEVTAKTLHAFYEEHGKLQGDVAKIYEASLPVIEQKLVDPGVDIYFVFNSVLNTAEQIVFDDDWKTYKVVNGTGDETINRFSLYYGCNNWHDGKHTRVCHDIEVKDSKYNHSGMVVKDDVIEIIYKAVTEDGWKVKGTHNITGLNVNGWKAMKPNNF